MAKLFAVQSTRGNTVISANPSDLNHTVHMTSALSVVKDKANSHERARASVSVKKRYEVASSCSNCNPHLDASVRIEISTPARLSAQQVADFKKHVLDVAVQTMGERMENGVANGFAAIVNVTVPE